MENIRIRYQSFSLPLSLFFKVPPLIMQIHLQNKQEMALTQFVNNSCRYQNNIVKPFDSVC